MFKTSRFWRLVLPDDNDTNTIKVAYGHTCITHITGVGVYRVIEGCSALPALGLLDRSKSETQGQLSRCRGVIRPHLGLLHLDSRDTRLYFVYPPKLSWDAGILSIRQNFYETPEFCVFANILGGRQYFIILLDFATANICVYFQYSLCIWVCANIFGAIVLTLGLRLIL